MSSTHVVKGFVLPFFPGNVTIEAPRNAQVLGLTHHYEDGTALIYLEYNIEERALVKRCFKVVAPGTPFDNDEVIRCVGVFSPSNRTPRFVYEIKLDKAKESAK